MDATEPVRFRLSAQRALLGHICPEVRSVSVDIDPTERRIWVRFVFDGIPPDTVREAASCAGTEIQADYFDWEVVEEFESIPAPKPMKHRTWLVFLRCEDEWVVGSSGHPAT